MAQVKIKIYCEDNGDAPFLKWFKSLPGKAQDKCSVRLGRLQEKGHELRRPEADYLRDAIYELRFKFKRVNYRVLYFFHGHSVVVLAHGLQKEKAVPPKEIEVAIDRRGRFVSDPERHTSSEEVP
jgi:phage-related protein